MCWPRPTGLWPACTTVRSSRKQITERILGALRIRMSSHRPPTGRLINQRDPYEVDLDAVILRGDSVRQAAGTERQSDAARPERRRHARRPSRTECRSSSPPTPTDTDGLDDMRYGVLQARRGGLTKQDVANTRSWSSLKKLISSS